MGTLLARLDALFFALAFGSLVLGILARLLGVRRTWPFFFLASLLLVLGLLLRLE